MNSVLAEVHATSITAIKICSHAIDRRGIDSRPILANRSQVLATLVIDTQEEFLRALGLSNFDLFELTHKIMMNDLIRCQRVIDEALLADLITCFVVNAILSKQTKSAECSAIGT